MWIVVVAAVAPWSAMSFLDIHPAWLIVLLTGSAVAISVLGVRFYYRHRMLRYFRKHPDAPAG
ncbi:MULTISPECIES: hypothetical protein [unclassified Streptomyces]|uniref:hypothetical protein n=1 Tax=unclassified Streptomyces TaxID=2593676 RepID=UPI000DC7E0F6|nr:MULTISPECIES: hypothetical protein [unclassified Streptomyces]AWZ07880.1 hypothetical protein DRB89_28365 [Streptomyces sp. ICC4]AWZ15533.1 hypothetical protein DRB96_28385 [Streptomyces sp. ICC1]